MKTYEGAGVQINIFFTPALVAGEWSASRLGRFTPFKSVPVAHCTGVCVGDEGRRKIFLLPGFEFRPLGRPGRTLSLYRLSYSSSLFLNPYLFAIIPGRHISGLHSPYEIVSV
jgi:hypothetical protein